MIMKSMTFLISVLFFSANALVNAAVNTETPYKGQQHRSIKALSQNDIDGYLQGKGMGFAKAAELNHYPGPRHVLDLFKELKLSDEQLKQTQMLFNNMRGKAIKLGKQLVDREQKLDQLFAQSAINKSSLETILQDIGAIQAKLRKVHLSTHLEQKQLLTKHQIMMYDRIRGYGANGSHNNNHSHSH